jgi:hypothetical protein
LSRKIITNLRDKIKRKRAGEDREGEGEEEEKKKRQKKKEESVGEGRDCYNLAPIFIFFGLPILLHHSYYLT